MFTHSSEFKYKKKKKVSRDYISLGSSILRQKKKKEGARFPRQRIARASFRFDDNEAKRDSKSEREKQRGENEQERTSHVLFTTLQILQPFYIDCNVLIVSANSRHSTQYQNDRLADGIATSPSPFFHQLPPRSNPLSMLWTACQPLVSAYTYVHFLLSYLQRPTYLSRIRVPLTCICTSICIRALCLYIYLHIVCVCGVYKRTNTETLATCRLRESHTRVSGYVKNM